MTGIERGRSANFAPRGAPAPVTRALMIATPDESVRSPLKAWIRALERTAAVGRDPSVTLPVLIERLAGRFADAPALIGSEGTLGYRELAAAANRYARWGLARGFAPGDGLCLPAERAPPALADRALYIYTSGTTGLPKAAIVSHLRLMQWSEWFAGLIDVQPHDRLYNCLPMYHSVGGVVACGAALVGGAAVVVRERFSVSRFWQDVAAERCTLFQYIGELCRYLVNAPHQAAESQHVLRLACGNGLRGEVWREFQQRFRIPQILEYYAATEGNFSLYNCERRPGAIGRIPPFLAHRMPVEIVRFDVEAGAPLRDARGQCVRCAADEVGEAIGQILDDHGTTRFAGLGG